MKKTYYNNDNYRNISIFYVILYLIHHIGRIKLLFINKIMYNNLFNLDKHKPIPTYDKNLNKYN